MAKQPELFSTDVPPWELDLQGECRVAKVVFAEPPHGPLDYLVPDSMASEVQLGVRVKVPLGRGNREMLGYVTAVEVIRQSPDAFKPIQTVLDPEPLFTPKLLELFQWMSRYYIAPLGQVFEAAVPAGVRASAGSRERVMLYPSEKANDDAKLNALSPKQQNVLRQLILAGGGVTIDQLQKLAECSTAPINSLRESGWIEARNERVFDELGQRANRPQSPPLALSVDQRQALAHVLDALDRENIRRFSCMELPVAARPKSTCKPSTKC